jgi:hypothetical protein
MFPECTLVHEELNGFNRIAEEEMYAIIIAIFDSIGQTTVIQFARFPRIDTHLSARCILLSGSLLECLRGCGV